MTVRRLSTKYFLAGAVLVLATVACGLFGVYTFARLSIVVGGQLHDSQETLDRTTRLATVLEREDDELLRAMDERSPRETPSLASQRAEATALYEELLPTLGAPEERDAAKRLHAWVGAYRTAADDLLRADDPSTALARYHQSVNPLLRRAVAECGAIREVNFREMQHAGMRARDEASRATYVVAAVAVLALFVSLAVARHLTRTVVRPVLALTESVEAIARGDFGSRVRVASEDELGRLGDGFNRMAAALDEFRRSNLGEVLRAKKNLEATLEALPDAVVVVNPEGNVDAMNLPARTLLRAERVESWRALALAEPAGRALEAALAGKTERARTDLSTAFAIGTTDATKRFLPIAAAVATPEGSGAVLVLYDVTDFARLDELRSEVVAVASHELKTPLTTIRMNLLLLTETTLAAQQREMLDTAVRGCDELATLTERFLDVTRIEAGQLLLSREVIDAAIVLEAVTDRWRGRCEDAGVTLTTTIERRPAPVEVDVPRLETALSNILGNAVKHTPKGGRIGVSLVSRAHG